MKKKEFENRDIQWGLNIGESEREVESLEFSTLTQKDIYNMSETLIYNSRLYERETHEIVENGPLDKRMGVGNKQNTCQTCHKRILECDGHFGVMKFGLPLYHIGYFRIVVQLLQGICKNCSHLMLDREQREGIKRKMQYRQNWTNNKYNKNIKEIIDLCKKNMNKKCYHCNYMNKMLVRKVAGQPCKVIMIKNKELKEKKDEFIIDDNTSDNSEYNDNSEQLQNINQQQDIDALQCQRYLEKIPQNDLLLLGFNDQFKAEELLCNILAVPPVQIRPTVPIGFGSTNEDDLTVKLSEMLQYSNDITKGIKNGQEYSKLNNDWYLLQSLFAQYLNSNAPGLPLQILGNKGIRALFQRLKGKHGRFRGNLSGKRVNFSGRTVISPDPNIEIDEVVLPIFMAKTLTFPERVNKHNYKKMQQLILNGNDIYPGANYIISKKGRIDLKFKGRRKYCEELQIGEIVERHLLEGDTVLFNRQPSLHRVSIMAHKVRVQQWNTLRFNECVCTPYNADFDGDEMNVHIPQNYLAIGEAQQLMGVQSNLRTPKSGDLLVALTQDFLTTAYLITSKNMFFSRAEFTQIISYLNNANEYINLPVPTIIKPVELWTGKQVVSLILRPNQQSQVIINLENKEKQYQNNMLYNCQKDGYVVFRDSELLMGQLGKNTLGGNKKGLFYSLLRDNGKQVTSKIMSRFSRLSARLIGELGMTISAEDVTPSQILQQTKQQILQQAYDKCQQQIVKFNKKELELKAGCDYEQTLESNLNGILSRVRDDLGELCKKTMKEDNKPLIMYTCGSKGSLINLCQMVGCVGQQVLNGNRVADGFTNRTLPHFKQNSKEPEAKGFVQNSYYDGLQATEFFFHTMAGREGLIDTSVKTAETGYMQRRLMKSLEDLKVCYDYSVRQEQGGQIVQFIYGEDGLDPLQMEADNNIIDLNRLLLNCYTLTKPYQKQELTKKQLIQIIDVHKNQQNKLIDKQQITEKFMEQLDAFWQNIIDNYDENNQNNNILNEECIKQFYSQLWVKYGRCLAVPGEAAGVVTGQSIGEPGTQMTLKTFHFAGVASMNVTMGVPRLKEIINAAKKITTPLISAQLIYPSDKLGARIVRARIEKTYLGDICYQIKEIYGPAGAYLSVKISEEAVNNLKLNINTQYIKSKIIQSSSTKFRLREDNVIIKKDWKINIKADNQKSSVNSTNTNLFFQLQQLKKILPEIVIKGIPTIQRAVIQKIEGQEGNVQIIVEGNGLKQVMQVPGINALQTRSNNIMEVQEVLGIEAARQTIYNEMQYVMGAHGLAVDCRHISLLSEVMAQSGQIAGITRFGLQKTKNSVLMLSSFEKTTEVLYDSAIFNQKDPLKGVSEAIIVGKQVPLGTNSFDVFLNLNNKNQNTNYKQQPYLFDEVVY